MRHFTYTSEIFPARFFSVAGIVLSSALLAPIVMHAQNKTKNWCGTDQYYEYLLKKDPSIALQRAKSVEKVKRYLKNTSDEKKTTKALKIIPTVVHVIHDDGAEKISTEQVRDGIRVMSEDYQRLNADTTDTRALFLPYAADCEIEFRLAQLDPFGNCTQGIVRVKDARTVHSFNDGIKSLSHWPENQYFNIWLVRSIGGGSILGYGQFPGGNWSTYGYVNVHNEWGTIGTSFSNGRTPTHEAGHCFALAHTFQGGCGTTNHCSSGDGIGDTPPTANETFGCNTSQNTCSNDVGTCSPYTTDVVDQIENYMSYDACQNMFTLDQKTVMIAQLTGWTQLINLTSAANLIATGTDNGFTAPPCAPIADFSNNFNEGCEGLTAAYSDKSYDADVDSTWTWSWNFPGGTPATSNLQDPSITYNAFGVYGATLTVSNSTGSDALTKTGIVTVIPITGEVTPLLEGIENLTFPAHPTDVKKDWDIVNPGGATWERTTTAFFSGAASARIR
ncbi:MAG: hypothetical protein FVQ77_16895, partial [Cytophagales bacterium]|nr:hypothetical protein [Cytophagales bacterium]